MEGIVEGGGGENCRGRKEGREGGCAAFQPCVN